MADQKPEKSNDLNLPDGPRVGLPDWAWIPLLSAGLIALMVIVGWTSLAGA